MCTTRIPVIVQAKGWGAARPYAPPPAGAPVLIAGDLGCLGHASERQPWIWLGRRIAERGCRPVALTPCPSRWWDPALAGLYFPVTMDRGAQVPPAPAGPLPWPVRAPDLTTEVRRDPGTHLLLTLLSPCIAITPPLIRLLRHCLPADRADVGSEAAAWQHPAFVGGDIPLLPGDPVELDVLRRAFADTGTSDQRQNAWELILAQQESTGASVAVRMEERALYAAQMGGTDAAAEAFFDRTGAVLEGARASVAEHARKLTAWVDRRAGRTHAALWRLSPGSVRLWLGAHPEALKAGATLPPGLEDEIHHALAARAPTQQFQTWRLVQRGEWLEWEPWPSSSEDELTSGSPVIGQLTTSQSSIVVREQGTDGPWLSLGLASAASGGRALSVGVNGWWVKTDFEELVIESIERLEWANTLGRDQLGLFVGFDDGRGERRAYWCSPGRGHPDWLAGGQTANRRDFASLWIEQGFFVDESQFRALGAEGFIPLQLRDSILVDDYGVRAEIQIKGIPVGLRWIWPGKFLMGSSETEQGRDDEETRHQVILPRGFWLAETVCTRTLWQVVMGDNPSYAKGPQRPVVGVSWEDIQRFIDRLNADVKPEPNTGRSSGPSFRLPSEAEWEHACPTGPFSFGDDISPKQANYDGNSPYRRGPKGLYRRETVEVASLPPNPWGFYEMHGNVWEWCQDWFADYPDGLVTNPMGPASGERRVLRGGSWFNGARSLRSAFRSHFGPGYSYRYHLSGFRLALGPEFGQASQAGGERDRTARARSER